MYFFMTCEISIYGWQEDDLQRHNVTRNAENQGRKSGDGKQFADSAASTLCAVITRANLDPTIAAAKQSAIGSSVFAETRMEHADIRRDNNVTCNDSNKIEL